MPNILALDLAQKTGFAHTDGTFGMHDFNWSSAPHGARWLIFQGWIREMLDAHPTEIIAYEAALHQKGAAARVANSLVTKLEEESELRGLKLKGYHASSIKKHATGNGRATKDQMAAAAFKRNPDIKLASDDVTDALFLLDLALSDLS